MKRDDLTQEEEKELEEALKIEEDKLRSKQFERFKKRKIKEVREEYGSDSKGLTGKVDNLLSKAGTGASKLLSGLFHEDGELTHEDRVRMLENKKKEHGFMKSLIGKELGEKGYRGDVFSGSNNEKKAEGGEFRWD